MLIQRVETSSRLSKIVIHAGIAYFSGQVPADPNQPFSIQMRSVLQKLDDLLLLAKTDKSHLLTAIIYLKDMNDFAAMNTQWEQWLPVDSAPARTTLRADMNNPNTLVEITVTVAVPVQGV